MSEWINSDIRKEQGQIKKWLKLMMRAEDLANRLMQTEASQKIKGYYSKIREVMEARDPDELRERKISEYSAINSLLPYSHEAYSKTQTSHLQQP
jgi:hypothetical protein